MINNAGTLFDPASHVQSVHMHMNCTSPVRCQLVVVAQSPSQSCLHQDTVTVCCDDEDNPNIPLTSNDPPPLHQMQIASLNTQDSNQGHCVL